MPIDDAAAPAIPLAGWADGKLSGLAKAAGSGAIARLGGATILGERAMSGRLRIPGRVSAGGGCRLLPTRDGRWLALTLAREADRELLPALFGDAAFDPDDDSIGRAVAGQDGAALLDRGRMLGLAVALADETPLSAPNETLTEGAQRDRGRGHRPLVIDMSAIWAGPLAGHLFRLAGAQVVKVESTARPDRMRDGDPALFDLLNQGKDSLSVDLSRVEDRAALVSLIRRADIVIEAARPRALRQLGIDADALVRAVPGLVWLTLTGHGASGEAANWIGLGEDCSVAGGLSQARHDTTGSMGFVGDAIADPLTGIAAALEGWRAYRTGRACRIGFAMSAIVADALADMRAASPDLVTAQMKAWVASEGQPFPEVERRAPTAPTRPLGADNGKWLRQ